MTSVALLTSVPLDRDAPDGFQPLHSAMAEAIADRWDLVLIDVVSDGRPLQHEQAILDRSTTQRQVVIEPRRSEGELSRLAPRRVGRRITDGVRGIPPDQLWTGTSDAEVRRRMRGAGLGEVDLAIVLRPVAHLTEAVSDLTRCVTVLAEGTDRRLTQLGAAPYLRRVARNLQRPAYEAFYARVGAHASSVVLVADHERFHFARMVDPAKLRTIPVTVTATLATLAPPRPIDGAIEVLVSGRFDHTREVYRAAERDIAAADAALASLLPGPRRWTVAGRGGGDLARAVGGIHWEGTHLDEVYAPAQLVLVVGPAPVGVRTTFLQGLAAGRPTIATWTTLWTAGAVHGRHAWAADTPAQLLSALAEAVTPTGAAVAAEGRQHFERTASWRVVKDRTTALVTELLVDHSS